jgi:hypothetical protein
MISQEELDKHVAKLVGENDAWEAFNNFYMNFPYIRGDKDCQYFGMLNSPLRPFVKKKLMIRIEELVEDPKNSQFKAMLGGIKRQPSQEEYSLFYPFYLQLREEGFSYQELVS